MPKRMSFDECTENNQLIELREADKDMAEELLKLAEHREEFWSSIKEKAKIYPSLFLEGYYEMIKELATAVLLLDGWKSFNHECLFAYLKEKNKI